MLLLLLPPALAADLAVGLAGPEVHRLDQPGLAGLDQVEVGAQGRLEVRAGLPRIAALRSAGAVVVHDGALTVDHLDSSGTVRVDGGSLALDQASGDLLVTAGALTLAPAGHIDGTLTLQGGLAALRTPARVASLVADADSELQLVGAGPLSVDRASLAGLLVVSPAPPCGQEVVVLAGPDLRWTGRADGLAVHLRDGALAVTAPCAEAEPAPDEAAGCGCGTGPSPSPLALLLPLLAPWRRRG